jgi:hypothetical protein
LLPSRRFACSLLGTGHGLILYSEEREVLCVVVNGGSVEEREVLLSMAVRLAGWQCMRPLSAV